MIWTTNFLLMTFFYRTFSFSIQPVISLISVSLIINLLIDFSCRRSNSKYFILKRSDESQEKVCYRSLVSTNFLKVQNDKSPSQKWLSHNKLNPSILLQRYQNLMSHSQMNFLQSKCPTTSKVDAHLLMFGSFYDSHIIKVGTLLRFMT